VLARQAQAAVVMNTTDMTADVTGIRDRFHTVAATTLDEALSRRPGARTDATDRAGAPASPSAEPPVS
jgi:hypothetical protein